MSSNWGLSSVCSSTGIHAPASAEGLGANNNAPERRGAVAGLACALQIEMMTFRPRLSSCFRFAL
eukprot:4511552-Amphidinium_carterae.1